MAVLFLAAVGQADAERSAEQRRLDIVHAQRVAAEHARGRSRRGSARQRPATPPVWTTTGPATTTIFSPCSIAALISAAVWRTAVSTCRSEEMPLDMKAKARRSRSLDSGTTRMPRSPDDDLVAAAQIAQPAAVSARPPSPRSWRPCAGFPLRSILADGEPGCGDWWWSRNLPARSCRARPRAVRRRRYRPARSRVRAGFAEGAPARLVGTSSTFRRR